MKKFILPLLAIIYTSLAFGQHTFKAIIKDGESKELLIGATAILQGTTNGASADQNGFIELKNIPDGKQTIIFSYLGYQEKKSTFHFPLIQIEPFEILLSADEGEELEEVVITSTRSSRTIDNKKKEI